MVLSELKNYIDKDMLTLLGEYKFQMMGDYALIVDNFIKISSYSPEQIVFKVKNNELTISGENFKIAELESKYVVVLGKFKNISFVRWTMKKYSYSVVVEGLNFNKLFNSFNKHNIKLYNYSRPNYKTCRFSVGFLDYFKIKKFKLFNNYNVKIEKTHNWGFLLNNASKNIGFYVGFMVVFCFCLLVSKTTLKIDVLGVDDVLKEEIVSQLSNFNVKTWQINHKTNEEIEKFLIQTNNNISLVSVVKKGTNLIVNIKEKIVVENNEVSSLCAPYNMVINSINVSQGIACVKVGDVVKKGDVLVKPTQVLTNGSVSILKPIAKIESTIWITGNVEFNKTATVFVRTGNKAVYSSFEVFNKQIFSSTPQLKFENYEKSVYNNYVFKNMFLPVKLHRIVFYETKAETINKNFEDYKSELIKQSANLAYSKLPKGLTVVLEETKISEQETKCYVTTYLQVNYVLEG